MRKKENSASAPWRLWPQKSYFFVAYVWKERGKTKWIDSCRHKHMTYWAAAKCLTYYEGDRDHAEIYYHRGTVPAAWKGMR